MRRTTNPAIPLRVTGEVDCVWQHVVHRISTELLARRQRGDFDRFACDYIYICLAEMIRIKWGANLVKIPRSIKPRITAAGEVLCRLLDLCSELWMLTPKHYTHPAWLFVDLFREWDVWGTVRVNAGEDTAFATLHRQIQTENQRLTECENPFTTPTAKEFFDIATQMAARKGGRFLTQTYRPFVQARKALASSMPRGEGIGVFRTAAGGIKPTQTRQKKGVQKATAEKRSAKGFQKN